MKVLIGECDLFRSVGGGQTFYRSLIERNPRIEFSYLRVSEPPETAVPANVRPLPCRPHLGPVDLAGFALPGVPPWVLEAFLKASNLARAASGRRFDIVDVPDYDRLSLFLPAALRHYGVSAGRVVLSMHGALSTALALNWSAAGMDGSLRRLEELQYAVVDGRYFISQAYQECWRGVCPLASHYLDPMRIFLPVPRHQYVPSDEVPTLNFIGRTEKRKGPHHFIQLLWWLPTGSYSAARLIGPDSIDCRGTSSRVHMRALADHRQVEVSFVDTLSRAGLGRLFATKAVTVVPSVVDTLSLAALESLLAGCPAVVSTAAGVSHYLRERFPELPFVPLDLGRFWSSLPAVEHLLSNYDAERERLGRALARIDLSPRGPSIGEIYSAPRASDRPARARAEAWFRELCDYVGEKPILSVLGRRQALAA